jgi:rhamnosyltransferase
VFPDKFSSEINATFVIASGCLIRTEVLKEVGLMNGQLFIDYIDVEWSLRAKHFGFNVFITSRAKMAHTIGDNRVNILGRTISIHNPLRRYYLIRNSFYLLRLPYVPIGYKLRELCFNLFRFFIGLFFSRERKIYLYYAFWGVRDGFSGIFGPCVHRF